MRQRMGGSIYRRGLVWWIKYYRDGQPIRESSGSTRRSDAVRLLSQRLGKLAAGEPVIPGAERVRMSELLDDLLTEYRVNRRRSSRRAAISVAHLKDYFGGQRVGAVGTATVRAYIDVRQGAGVANGTINRELAALKRALALARQAGRLGAVPYIPMLTEDNVRTGFFEEPEFRAVLAHLPEDLKPVAEFMYLTGWRIGEVLALGWRQVEFQAGTVRLEPGTTKNAEGRTFPFAALPALETLLRAQRERTVILERARARIIPCVFHRRGKPIKDLRGAWQTATERAGLPGRIPHDFRRTAVRNLERAGVPRSVAMKLTGHRTESVYRRYAIVNEADLSAGVAKLAVLHADQAAGARAERKVVALGHGHNSGHSEGQAAPRAVWGGLAKAAK